MDTEMEIGRDTNWAVKHGCVEDTLVFRSPHSAALEESELGSQSRPLLLYPIPHSSSPCELTYSFGNNQCCPESIYVRSTARVIEIYSKTDYAADNEYICTARAELCTHFDNTEKAEGSIFNKLDSIRDNHLDVPFDISSLTSSEDINPSNFGRDNPESKVLNLSVSNVCNKLTDVSRQGNKSTDEIARNESNCSDEDSWIEVDSSGSFMTAASDNTGEISERHSPRNKGSEGEGNRNRGRNLIEEKSLQRIIEKNGNEPSAMQDFSIETTSERTVKVPAGSSISFSNGGANAETRENEKTLIQPSIFSGQRLYEAKLSLDTQPYTSLTVRLLSLQNKSLVGIDKIDLCGVHSSTEDVTIPISSKKATFQGSPSGTSLLALLFQNMMHVPKRGIVQHQNGVAQEEENMDHYSGLTKLDSSLTTLCREHSPSGSSSCFEEKKISSTEERLSSSLDEFRTTLYELPPNHCTGQSSKNKTDKEIDNFYRAAQCTVITDKATTYMCNTTQLKSPVAKNSEPTAELSEFASPNDSAKENNEECDYGALQSEEAGKMKAESTLDSICKRIDKLEGVCLRIEDYVCRSLSNMEKRLQLVETHLLFSGKDSSKTKEGSNVYPGVSVITSHSSPLNNTLPELVTESDKLSTSVNMTRESCSNVHPVIPIQKSQLISPSENCIDHSMPSFQDTISSDKPSSAPLTNSDTMGYQTQHLADSDESSIEQREDTASFDMSKNNLNLQSYTCLDLDPSMKDRYGKGSDNQVCNQLLAHRQSCTENPGKTLDQALVSNLSAFLETVSFSNVVTEGSCVEIPSCALGDQDKGEENLNFLDNDSQSDTPSIHSRRCIGSLDLESKGTRGVFLHNGTWFDSCEEAQCLSQECFDTFPNSFSQTSDDDKHCEPNMNMLSQTDNSVSFHAEGDDEFLYKLHESSQHGEKTSQQMYRDDSAYVNNRSEFAMLCENGVDVVETQMEDNSLVSHSNEFTFPEKERELLSLQDVSIASILTDFDPQSQGQIKQLLPSTFFSKSSETFKMEEYVSSEGLASICANLQSREMESHRMKAPNDETVSGGDHADNDFKLEHSDEMESGGDHADNDFKLEHNEEDSIYQNPYKEDSDLSVLLNASFTNHSGSHISNPLEFLLSQIGAEKDDENIEFYRTPAMEVNENLYELQPAHGIFFVEDEGVEDFVEPSTLKLSTAVNPSSFSADCTSPDSADCMSPDSADCTSPEQSNPVESLI